MVKQPTGQVTHGSAPYCAPEASDALSQGRPRPLRRSVGHSVTATRLLRVAAPQLGGHDSIRPPAYCASLRLRLLLGYSGMRLRLVPLRRSLGPVGCDLKTAGTGWSNPPAGTGWSNPPAGTGWSNRFLPCAGIGAPVRDGPCAPPGRPHMRWASCWRWSIETRFSSHASGAVNEGRPHMRWASCWRLTATDRRQVSICGPEKLQKHVGRWTEVSICGPEKLHESCLALTKGIDRRPPANEGDIEGDGRQRMRVE